MDILPLRSLLLHVTWQARFMPASANLNAVRRISCWESRGAKQQYPGQEKSLGGPGSATGRTIGTGAADRMPP